MTPEVIFGGTFDPPHLGHVRLMETIRTAFPAIRIVLMPCYQPVHKTASRTPPEHRLGMLEALAESMTGVTVSTLELRAERPQCTRDTLRAWRRRRNPDTPLLFAMGGDSFASLGSWLHWQDIPGLAHLLILQRPGYSSKPAADVAREFASRWVAWPARRLLLETPAGRALELRGTPEPWSSSELRQTGTGRDEAIPDPVINYMTHHQLYLD